MKKPQNVKEVIHHWANQAAESGECGNVSYNGAILRSYNAVIGRILPNGTALLALRDWSATTQKHNSWARMATSNRTAVFAEMPAASCYDNMATARREVADKLTEAEKPRLMEKTRLALKARALHLAEQANRYWEALPEDERTGAPIDTSQLENMRAELAQMEADAAAAREAEVTRRRGKALENLATWRAGGICHDLSTLPPALRLRDHPSIGQIVETSHGASIPVADAIRLWPLVQRVITSGQGLDVDSDRLALGPYRLNAISAQGDITVGCHRIAFSELETLAVQLGLKESA